MNKILRDYTIEWMIRETFTQACKYAFNKIDGVDTRSALMACNNITETIINDSKVQELLNNGNVFTEAYISDIHKEEDNSHV